MEGDHARKPLLQEKYVEAQPHISPNGPWMAYTSNESGRNEVYVRPFPEVDGTLDTMVISFLITGRLKWAISIGFVELFTKTVLYYLHVDYNFNGPMSNSEQACEQY